MEREDEHTALARPVTAKEHLAAALRSSLGNRYLLSNCVYFAYATAMLVIDFSLYPSYQASSNAGDNDTANATYALINRTYLAFGAVHLVNSLQYYWSWLPNGYRWHHRVMLPEYLNMAGACIYLYTASLYPQCDDTYSATTIKVHHWETAASAIEVVAAFGWTYTWWLTFPRGVAGRGYTLDDPDVWGILFIVVPSLVYIAYNIQIIRDPSQYGSNFLYTTGDLLYWIGSVFYLLAALRDDGWFYWMPAAGQLPGGRDHKQPYEPRDLVFDDDDDGDEEVVEDGKAMLLPHAALSPAVAVNGDGMTAKARRRRCRGISLRWFCGTCLGCGCPRCMTRAS